MARSRSLSPTRKRASSRARAGAASLWIAGLSIAASLAWAQAIPDPAPPKIVAMVDAGDFRGASDAIDAALAAKPAPAQRDALLFERERMRRIRLDFDKTEADVRKALREAIPDLRDDEVAQWDRTLLEHMTIDGEKRYFSRAASNLWRLSPQAVARRATPPKFSDSPLETLHPHHRAARAAALASGKPSVLPQRFRITQSLTVEADAVPAGETIRAWIPYPREIAGHQEDVQLVSGVPASPAVAPAATMQRSAYVEGKAVAGRPTKFAVTYDVTISAQDHAIDPANVRPLTAAERKDLAPFLAERAPHVVFTDAMRALSKQAVGDETDPYRVARTLFDLVDDQFPWAGAREYSTISNIGDYALHARHADCGQQTLLLITLLRLNGIPARWQSGMMFSPGKYWNLHDWGQVYLAPYGWVPMDVTFGRLKGDPALTHFYLGGLDGYRVAFNDDWGTAFQPAKTAFRSDTVDAQRGEVEWRGGNLYYDQFDYDFEWSTTTPTQSAEKP